MRLRVIPLLVVVWMFLQRASSVDIDQTRFLDQLQQMTNGYLGINQFQQFIDDQKTKQLNFLNSYPNGQLLSEQISNDIDSTVQRYIAAVRNIQTAYMNGNEEQQITLDLCCQLSNLVDDLRFKRPVDSTSACHITRIDMKINSAIKDAMIRNLQELSNIKWQYLSTEEGQHCTYPARNLCNESFVFDPRYRPWYTATVNRPKDIIILIDRSSSMNDLFEITSPTQKIAVAKNAAAAVIQYLNPNDRVGLLAYTDSVLSVNSTACFATELAVATKYNQDQITKFLQSGIATDGSKRARLSTALNSAYQMFNKTRSNTTKGLYLDSDKVILVLTDGNQEDDCQALQDLETQLFNNSVNIFMLGIGQVLQADRDKLSCLRSLAAGPRGVLGFVPNSEIKDLRGQLGFYYNAFIDTIDRTNATLSIPFTDINGLALEMSVCLPLFRMDQSLGGVTCVEISVDDIFQDVVNFRLGKFSYGFVIDRKGRVILHPLLPQPANWRDQPTLFEMTEVEIFNDATEIEARIISGTPGNKSVIVKWFTPNGQSVLQGVSKFGTTATYYWHSIPSAKLFICLVFMQNETNSSLQWSGSFPDVLLADEIDLNAPGKCAFFGRISMNNKTVVKLAPKSFRAPRNYTERNITPIDIQRLKSYITWKGPMPDTLGLKNGIRDVVATTNVLETSWLKSIPPSTQQHILSMYIGTVDGVYRRFPPVRIPTAYDPTQQPWYVTGVAQAEAGVAQAGAIRFALPFLDFASKVPVVSISQIVLNRNVQRHTAADGIFGVMGMDLTIKFLYTQITSTISQCNITGNECFAIDLSGFVVIHKSFQANIPSGSLHIAALEPSIAAELIQLGILVPDTCVNYADQPLTNQRFFQTSIPFDNCMDLKQASICKVKGGDSSGDVVSTNIFLIVQNKFIGTSGNCDCGNIQNENNMCKPTSNGTTSPCQCPCRMPINYDTCLANLNIDPVVWTPCIPSGSPPIQSDNLAMPALESCLPCTIFTDEQLCTANQCYWPGATSACSSTPASTVSTSLPPTTSPAIINGSDVQPPSSNLLGLAIGIPIAVAVLVAAVVVACVCFKKRSRQHISVNIPNDLYKSVSCEKSPNADSGPFISVIQIKNEPLSNNPSSEYSSVYSDVGLGSPVQQLSGTKPKPHTQC